ncbi:MAG: hypothetical protein ABIP94_08525 [Planctomycetota bacterium]
MDTHSLASQGFAIVANVIDASFCARLGGVVAGTVGDGAGCRTGLVHAAVPELATSPAVRALVEPVLGSAFSKTQ